MPVTARVPVGHKVATEAIPIGAPIRKYAQIIGYASQPVAAGDHLHTQNVAFCGTKADSAYATDLQPVPPAQIRDSFLGCRRENGLAGDAQLHRHCHVGGLLGQPRRSAPASDQAAAHYFGRDLGADAF